MNDATKALKLPTLLEGEALAVWLELSEKQQECYATAKEEICTALKPMEFVSLDEFHRRNMRPGETLSVFVHDLKKLLERAIPGLDKKGRDQHLLHQFLAGIPDAVSRQLRATGETKTLDAAVVQARLLMTIDDHGQAEAVAEGPTEVQLLREQVALLTEQVATLSTSRLTANDQPQVSLISDQLQVLPLYEAERRTQARACAIVALEQSEADVVDDCAVRNYHKAPNIELPECSDFCLYSVVDKHRDLFCTTPGVTEAAYHSSPPQITLLRSLPDVSLRIIERK